MKVRLNPEEIAGYECRFAVYCPPQKGSSDDMHLVKETIHMKDGRQIPNLRHWKNFQRPYWITKKAHRDHHDWKEWDDLDKMHEHTSTQSKLIRNIAKNLEMPWYQGSLRQLCQSPYVYGADILSTSLIKKTYQDKFPQFVTPFTMATFDTETDMVHGTGFINIATIAFQHKVFTYIDKAFVEGYTDVIATLHKKLDEYIGEYVRKRKLEWEFKVVDSEAQIVLEILARAHEYRPDILSIWNMDFDIPKVVQALERASIDPKTVFSDPSIPREFQRFYYKQGPSQKVTASGKMTPIPPAGRWHSVFTPSSFYILDAMCVYWQLRNQKAKKQSYALDSILDEHLGIRKLKFAEADHIPSNSADWHSFMQSQYPLEYIIYNGFDCISMHELEDEIKDITRTAPFFSGYSDFAVFNKGPRRIVDDLHTFCLERGKVIGTTSDEMKTEQDELLISPNDWIITLPAALIMDHGLQVIEEIPTVKTSVFAHVADLDVSSAYQNNGDVINISRETTHRELCSIEGVTEEVRRQQGINLAAGFVNTGEVMQELFGLPTFDELLTQFQKDQSGVSNPSSP